MTPRGWQTRDCGSEVPKSHRLIYQGKRQAVVQQRCLEWFQDTRELEFLERWQPDTHVSKNPEGTSVLDVLGMEFSISTDAIGQPIDGSSGFSRGTLPAANRTAH